MFLRDSLILMRKEETHMITRIVIISIVISICGCNAETKQSGFDTTVDGTSSPPVSTDNTDLENRNHVSLVASSSGRTLELAYEPADAVQPRVAELRVQLSSDVTFASATAGDALTDAGKELISQVEPGNIVRLVALSAGSATTIGGGTLATISISRKGSGPSSAELLLDRPLFAPAEANDGLLVDGDVSF
jgi:hypothetical protein